MRGCEAREGGFGWWEVWLIGSLDDPSASCKGVYIYLADWIVLGEQKRIFCSWFELKSEWEGTKESLLSSDWMQIWMEWENKRESFVPYWMDIWMRKREQKKAPIPQMNGRLNRIGDKRKSFVPYWMGFEWGDGTKENPYLLQWIKPVLEERTKELSLFYSIGEIYTKGEQKRIFCSPLKTQFPGKVTINSIRTKRGNSTDGIPLSLAE